MRRRAANIELWRDALLDGDVLGACGIERCAGGEARNRDCLYARRPPAPERSPRLRAGRVVEAGWRHADDGVRPACECFRDVASDDGRVAAEVALPRTVA